MKATGLIRRIDDLGRIQIPKEVRKMIGLKEDYAPFEFFIDGDSIVIKRYKENENE
jgi:transcriptional pleiotropic regulator of transition state genes